MAVESSKIKNKKYRFDVIKELWLNSRIDSSLATFSRCELNNLARDKADEFADRPHFFPSAFLHYSNVKLPISMTMTTKMQKGV